jgi:hypothetical protein
MIKTIIHLTVNIDFKGTSMKKVLITLSLITSSLIANIGEITALKGTASLIHNGNTQAVKVGTVLEEHDELTTSLKSKLQIVFKDKTVISLGQNSHFKIDEYLFEDKKVAARFSVSKGFFKSITGRIGKIAPKRFKIKTANATIGVRGTTIIGEVSPKRDIIACSRGEIVVSNARGSMVVGAGERTIVNNMKMPSQSQKVNKVILKQLDSKSNTTVTETPVTTTTVSKKDIVKKDVALVEEKTAEKFEPWVDTQERQTLKSIEKAVGTPTPTYSGKITEGTTTNGNIDTANSSVKLGFDLGSGKVNGALKFQDTKTNYDIKVDGKVRNNGTFNLTPKDGYAGSSKGKLEGKKFEHANGDFSFSERDGTTQQIFNKIDGKFKTSR